MVARNQIILGTLFILVASSMLLLVGCGSSSGPVQEKVDPPSNVQITVDAISGGSSFAIVSWDGSDVENDQNFNGYRIVTYQLDNSNKIVSKFTESLVPKSTHSSYINNIQRQVRYRSYVMSVLSDGTRSDSVSSPVYGGVYYNNDGIIDQDANGDTTYKSGYGWDVNSGFGTPYAFVSKNASGIDIYCKYQGGLQFYSPDQFLTGGKTTLFGIVGSGQQAFDQTNLNEPQYSNVEVDVDSVYLIKTKEGNYIKLWVKRIDIINNISEVIFEYKVQPISGLRIVKK
jgi:hypothetical protein